VSSPETRNGRGADPAAAQNDIPAATTTPVTENFTRATAIADTVDAPCTGRSKFNYRVPCGRCGGIHQHRGGPPRLYVSRALTGDASVRFAFDAGVVALIKVVVPPRYRKWHANTKTWGIGGRYVDAVIRAARIAGQRVIDDSTGGRATGSGERVDRPRQRMITTWAETLFAAVGPERAEPVFKALVKVLHPDAGGDTQLMQDLNRAHDQLGRGAAA
jgi:hypothetical protein